MKAKDFLFESSGGHVFFYADKAIAMSSLLFVFIGTTRAGEASKGDRVQISGESGLLTGTIRRIERHQMKEYDVESTVLGEFIRVVVGDISHAGIEEYINSLETDRDDTFEVAEQVEEFVWQYINFPVELSEAPSTPPHDS